MKRMLSGIKPTGQLTLGNYIGALRNFVKYQDEYEMYVFIANLHCITEYQVPADLRKNLKDAIALYLACGLDPEKATIFLQTDVPAHATLGYIMACTTNMGELSRMTQYKERKEKNPEGISAGLFTYPCLMAADILLYDADYVPVGDDQKQHVELARDIAERFNNRYSSTFTLPEPLIQKVGARIMSLDDPTKKMSKSEKSDKGCIYLLDDLALVRKKIKSAVTDSYATIKVDKEKQPGIFNLLSIAASMTDNTPEGVAEYANSKNMDYADLKEYIADIVCKELSEIQEGYRKIISSGEIDTILADGARRASSVANKKLAKVQKKIGLEIR